MSKDTEPEKDEWRVAKIELQFQTYGDNKGKYEGKITFQNKEWEGFTFKIRPDMADAYIQLLSKDIVRDASSLASRLMESLGLTPEQP